MKRLIGMILAVIASGAMIALALPPSGIWVFGWFALMPVFWATRQTRLIYGVVVAIAATTLTAFIASSGIFYRHGSADGNAMWTYLGCSLFGFVFSIVAGIAAEVKAPSLKSLAVLSAIGVLLELTLLWLLPAPLALSQARFRPMLLLASVTGIWGIGFLLWFFNLAVTEVLRRNKKCLPVVIGLPVILLMADLATLFLPKSDVRVEVGVVQSDSIHLSTYRRLSEAAGGARLVVWPEFGGILFTPGGDTRKLSDLALERGMPAFVTSYRDDYNPLPHNVATLFSRSGASEPYFKRRLFGAESKMHTPGINPVAVSMGDLRIGLNICFDSCYPSIIRDTVRQSADIIALPTIDPDSPNAFFAANHAAFTPIRAAENGVSIIRCDGGSYSMIVDPDGKIMGELGDVADRSMAAFVPTKGHGTVYRWAGDWFLYACGGVVLWALLTRRKPKESASTEPRLPA